MTDKSLQKRKYILDGARKVFMEKGFRVVTMKDVVEACDISRGGLYLYFSSTEELFLEVLKMEEESSDDAFSQISAHATPTEILSLFFKVQKKELLHMKDGLGIATLEYAFANGTEGTPISEESFYSVANALQKIISMGMEKGEFKAVDAHVVAENIMFVLEGLKITALTIGITEQTIDRAFVHLMRGLIIEDI